MGELMNSFEMEWRERYRDFLRGAASALDADKAPWGWRGRCPQGLGPAGYKVNLESLLESPDCFRRVQAYEMAAHDAVIKHDSGRLRSFAEELDEQADAIRTGDKMQSEADAASSAWEAYKWNKQQLEHRAAESFRAAADALDAGQPRTQVTMGFGIHAEGLLRKTLENDPDMFDAEHAYEVAGHAAIAEGDSKRLRRFAEEQDERWRWVQGKAKRPKTEANQTDEFGAGWQAIGALSLAANAALEDGDVERAKKCVEYLASMWAPEFRLESAVIDEMVRLPRPSGDPDAPDFLAALVTFMKK